MRESTEARLVASEAEAVSAAVRVKVCAMRLAESDAAALSAAVRV